MIKLDYTQISVVVKCSLCPSWAGLEHDRPAGWAAGGRHERQVHPGAAHAAKNR